MMREERLPTQGYEQIICFACDHTEIGGVSKAAAHINTTGHPVVCVKTVIGPATGFEKQWKEKYG